MSSTKINVGSVVSLSPTIISAKNTVTNVKSMFQTTTNQVDGRVMSRNNLRGRFQTVSSQLSSVESKIQRIKNMVETGANSYYNTDRLVVSWKYALLNQITGKTAGIGLGIAGLGSFSVQDKEKGQVESKEKSSLWSWKDTWKMVSQAGILGSATAIVGDLITGGVSVKNGFTVAKDVSKTVENIAKAIPKSGTSFDWKTLFGITEGTKKTFQESWSEGLGKLNFGNAKTVSEKIAVGAKWAGNIFTIGATGYENFFDDKENNSLGRKAAETVGESTVKILEGMVIGAALGAVGAPAVVVGVGTVAVTWVIDKLFEAGTGKNAAEWMSDFVLDFPDSAIDIGKKAINFVGNTAKNVFGGVSCWWSKAFG